MLTRLWYLILRILGLVKNYTTKPEEEVRPTLPELHEELKERIKEIEEDEDELLDSVMKEEVPVPPPSNRHKTALAILDEPFDGPLETIPLTMYGTRGVYTMYGRAPKEGSHKKYSKAKLIVARGLPGSWNGGSKRLYVLGFMEEYLREALRRCGILGVLGYFERLGAYCYRHMRHDPDAPLSLHSWACALDFNTSDNIARYRSPTWKNSRRRPVEAFSPNARYGPIPPPFSKGWKKLWPCGVPYLAILAFKSVGFEWGGDWGRHKWEKLVEVFGEGYDEDQLDMTVPWIWDAIQEWKTIEFIDPMHVQLKWERDRDDVTI